MNPLLEEALRRKQLLEGTTTNPAEYDPYAAVANYAPQPPTPLDPSFGHVADAAPPDVVQDAGSVDADLEQDAPGAQAVDVAPPDLVHSTPPRPSMASVPDDEPPPGQSPASRVSEALYAAFARRPLSSDYFARPAKDELARWVAGRKGAAGDPFAAEKVDIARQRADVARMMAEHNINQAPIKNQQVERRLNQGETGLEHKIGQDATRNMQKDREFGQRVEEFGYRKEENARDNAARERAASAVQDRFGRGAFKDFAKHAENELDAAVVFEQIDAIAPNVPKGIMSDDALTSLDRFKAAVPLGLGSHFTAEQKTRLNAAIGMLRQTITRPLAGANLTTSEKAVFDQIFNDQIMADPAAQVAVLDVFRQRVGANLARKEAIYRTVIKDPNVWSDYETQGGITSRSPIFGPPNPHAQRPGPQAGVQTAPRPSYAPPPVSDDTDKDVANPEDGGPMDTSVMVEDGLDAGQIDALRGPEPTTIRVPNRGGPSQKAGVKNPINKGGVERKTTVTVTNGEETLEIDAADLKEAQAEGFKVVR